MSFTENIRSFVLQNPGYEIKDNLKKKLSIALLVFSLISFSYFNQQILKYIPQSISFFQNILIMGILPLVIVTLLILLLLYHDTIKRLNKQNTITTTDWLMAFCMVLSFFYALFCFSLFHWVPIFYLVLCSIQLSVMTRGKSYGLYWVIWFPFFGWTILASFLTGDYAYLNIATLFFVVALFKFIEDWIASLFSSSPSPGWNTYIQERKILYPTIKFSLCYSLIAFLFYCIFLYSINDLKMIARMDMEIKVSQFVVNFYLFALPLHVTIFTLIAGVFTIVHTLRSANPNSNLPTKIAQALEAFIIMYIIIFGFLVLGFLTSHFMDLPWAQDSSWSQKLLLLMANFAFEFSILVIMPTLVYVYALITGLMKVR